MSTVRFISPHTTDKDRQGRPEKRPDAPYFDVPPPDDEDRLNSKLKEFLDYASDIMALTGQDESKKWIGIKGLMKQMQDELPYLINAETQLELEFEDKIGSRTLKMKDSLSYSQFIDALNSEETMDKHYKYIVSHCEPIGKDDNQRAPLWAEGVLMMLYSALKLELDHHEKYQSFFVDDDESEAPAENVVLMPHFGMENSERAQKRWEAAYEALANEGYLRRNEVDYHGWVYICCGQQTPPDGPIVWHGSNASLAHLVRKHFRGKWDKALKIFCPENGKTFPVSFNTTHKPVDDVTKSIDQAFQTANSH